MRFSILTLNPGFFRGALDEGMIRIARQKGLLDVAIVPIRDFTDDRYGTTDDYPYGGGAGMVMKAEPILRAHESVVRAVGGESPRTFVTSPQGRPFTQDLAREMALEPAIAVLCGRYKGIDERVIPLLNAEEISIGDYVLSGGEPAAMVILDALARLLPGVLGDAESAEADSFSEPLLDAPVYTRPEDFQGRRVPDVLLSGDHERIRVWRRREAIRRTWLRRPDLLLGRALSKEDQSMLDGIKEEEGR
ncbi:MAG TPA: tRNA (guanosine(37)-N1)-methyltransferase TrmD [Candidatus Limnocylindrales bacterium]|nr:tRNA (guanosine(37)-N1)-methyltransferase TrmD [Candidatus Limnocylindrales bacterium]